MVIIALCIGIWSWSSWDAPAIADTISREKTFVVRPQSVSQQLHVAGTIIAGKSVAIVAPFDGVIREKRVQLGDHVTAGDVLAVMDTSDIASRYRDAQSAYLKAAMAVEALEKWQGSADMQRARRSLETAQSSLNLAEREVAKSKALLDQGIVSRNEYDGLVQQRDTQVSAVASARDELAATEARGDNANRQLVMLESENAESRLNDLKQQMAGAKIATAVAGIVTRLPLNRAGQSQTAVEPGASITRGTAMFAIADTDRFVFTGAVDEVDVNSVKIGQAVSIASDAFPSKTIDGRIVGVSAEAGGLDVGRSAPTFDVRATFSVDDPSLKQAIRIGMSARMTVQLYSNPLALVVPPSAILNTETGSQIRILKGKETALVPVSVGATFPQGIEIKSGLQVGDLVLDADLGG